MPADTNLSPRADIMRSPLGRARGLGAAGHGAGVWWTQKLLSMALVPLTIWFIISVFQLAGANRDQMLAWMHSPWRIGLMSLLVVITFYHLALGLQVVIEDYVHHDLAKLAINVLQKGLCLLLAVVCLISTLKLGL